MSVSLSLLLPAAALIGCGVYLVLERSLTRVLVGLVMLGNGVNLLFMVASGRPGKAPIIGSADPSEMSDPLPQAMVLTAIVIALGMVGFVMSMAYRSWQLNGHDEVQDDLEDRRVARKAAANAPAYHDSDSEDSGETLDEDAAETRDETIHDDEEAELASAASDGSVSDGSASAPRAEGDA